MARGSLSRSMNISALLRKLLISAIIDDPHGICHWFSGASVDENETQGTQRKSGKSGWFCRPLCGSSLRDTVAAVTVRSRPARWFKKESYLRSTRSFVAAGMAIATAVTLAAAAPASASPQNDTHKLRNAVTAAGVLKHMRQFQAIADANGDTRLVSTPGYVQSTDYVVRQLERAGYAVTRQPFDFPFFQEVAPSAFDRVSPNPAPYVPHDDFATMTYSGSGDVSAPITAVDLVLPPGPTPSTSTSGCEASDFAGFPAGNVALIQRGTCTFGVKAQNAQAAGASAVLVFNEGQPGRIETTQGTLGGPGVTIPVLGTSFAVGEELAGLPGATVHVKTVTMSEIRQTENILADTRRGQVERTVVVGAHLDSVDNGPGINDNGSGSATILEIALKMAKLDIKPVNRVRFAFWGAEELGLLGSEYYVSQLSPQDIAEHRAQLEL